jgi:hypothetical protein
MAKDDIYNEQVDVRVSRNLKSDLRETGAKFSMRISDFARVALAEGLRQIKTRGTIAQHDDAVSEVTGENR